MDNNLTAEAAAQLQEGISLVLSRWAALRMAVENEWGGRDSLQKSQHLGHSIFHRLTQSKEQVYIDDLEDMLDEFMLSLNTVIGDGSIEEIAEKFLVMREECLEGNFNSIKRLKETNAPSVSYVGKPSTNDEDDNDDDDGDSDENWRQDISSEMEVDSLQSKSALNKKNTTADGPSLKEEVPEIVDGWTVVAPRRNKGNMFNINPLLSKRSKTFGNPRASSSSRQPSKGVQKDSCPLLLPKGKLISRETAEGASRAKGKEPAPQAKRPKPGGSKIRHGKGKPLCPHLLDIDSSHDLWHHPELGVKDAIRDADLAYVRSQSSRELATSVYCDLARVVAVIEILTERAEAYEDMRNKVEDLEDRCRGLTLELSQLRLDRDSTHKQLEKELISVREELKTEISTGRGYLDTLDGQRYIKSLEDAAVFKYKESDDFKSLEEAAVLKYKASEDFGQYLSESSIHVFNECLAFCRERLVNSRRFPGETFEFLDPDWVEMIDVPPSEALAAARSSQVTSLLHTLGANEDVMIDIEGKDVVP